MKTILGPIFGLKGPKSGPKLVFFVVFLTLIHWFSLKLHAMIACKYLTSSRGKTHKTNFWGPNLEKNGAKSSPKLGFLAIFSSLVH